MTTSSQPPEPLRASAPPGDSDRIRTLLLRAEQVKLLFTSAPLAFAGHFINGTFVTFILWDVTPHPRLIAWLIYMLAVASVRFLFVRKFWQRSPDPVESSRWGRWFSVGSALSGLGWGLAAFFIFPEQSIPHQVFLALVVAGMGAGAVTLIASVKAAFLSFTIPTFLPLIFRLLIHPDPVANAMGVMVAIFAAYMISTGLRMHGTIATSLSLRFENQDLVADLTSQINERKQAEERLRQANADLTTANQELESFSYSVSHDLLAPLRHLDGFASLLKEHAGHSLDAKGLRYLEFITESSKQMGRLTANLLAFSRMGRTELRKSWVSLDQLTKEALHELEPDLKGRHITWTIRALPEVEGDAVLLRQVMVNLIANAVKYTRPREQAHIEIGPAPGPPQNGEMTILVRDNGVGFDMDHADKLFGVFQRLHHADEFEGTGIGLAHVRRIVQRHGGRVWAEGAVDRGATFYISLPVGNRGLQEAQPSSA
jgi:signal transduction histidine kinase